ncbi:sigma 54-interacting transcriptional regulator [bacterium]|nr:sigma 54-interacting transcriptional regulator [candidate division CSSED10-310 bacterium]
MAERTPLLITQDPALLSLLSTARRIAEYHSNILIMGESGTGKDLLAEFIHQNSPRKLRKFMKIDLSAIPVNLMESELFGHVRGAFSGAYSDRDGRLIAAHGGTVFLDHINELPLEVQAKLNRVLQEKQFEPVGSNVTMTVDVRFIAASRLDLGDLVRKRVFREDLYFRLSIMPIQLPPLRARPGDIPMLAKHYLEHFAKLHGKLYPRLHPSALDLLCSYHWPGNIRELQNQMERLIITSDGKKNIMPSHLYFEFDASTGSTIDALADECLTLEQIEKLYIQKILQNARGNKSKAARILGINRKTLLEKRKRYGLD